jgi:hypothetical protein
MAMKIPLIYENVFGKSAEKSVSARKIGTILSFSVLDETGTRSVENTTQIVGTKIVLFVGLDDENHLPLRGKNVDIYHRINTTLEKIKTVVTGTTNEAGMAIGAGQATAYYTLAKAGTHTFYAQFAGDDTYEGCEKAVRAFAK